MKNRLAVIRNGRIIYDDIGATTIQPNETAARERRESMKTKHRKALLQKNQTEFYRAYPEQLENLSDETKRLLS